MLSSLYVMINISVGFNMPGYFDMKRCMTQQIFWLRCFLSSEGKRLNHSCFHCTLLVCFIICLCIIVNELSNNLYLVKRHTIDLATAWIYLLKPIYVIGAYWINNGVAQLLRLWSFDYNKCLIIFISYFKSYLLHYTWKEIH